MKNARLGLRQVGVADDLALGVLELGFCRLGSLADGRHGRAGQQEGHGAGQCK